jgi:hypothetical protein
MSASSNREFAPSSNLRRIRTSPFKVGGPSYCDQSRCAPVVVRSTRSILRDGQK